MSSLIQAQRKALEGVDQATINQALGDKSTPAPATATPAKDKKETPVSSVAIKAAVEARGDTYQPDIYDYRIVGNEVQRKKKTGK
jgi:hypothetical protein